MMSPFKKNNYSTASMYKSWFIFAMMMMMIIKSSANGDDSSSLTGRGISTDTTQATSSSTNDIFNDSTKKMSEDDNIPTTSVNENDVKITTPSIVLQPNIAGALDVGQGLLVPLVPVVDPNSKNNQPQSSPLIANLLPVSVETVTPAITNVNAATEAEMRRQIHDDMDVAEDIVFRPLFRYRQEVAARRKSYNQNRYYQPYIYAYKPSRKSNYNDDNDRQSLSYYSRDDYNN